MKTTFPRMALCAALAAAFGLASPTMAQNYQSSQSPQYSQSSERSSSQQNRTTCSICGLTVQKSSEREEGLKVVEVKSGSPADDAKIRQGDMLTSINNEPLDSPDQLQRLMQQSQRRSSEADVRVRLQRDDRTRQVTLTLDPANDNAQRYQDQRAQSSQQAYSPQRQTDQRDESDRRDRADQRDPSARDRQAWQGEQSDRDRDAALGVTLDPSPQRLGQGIRIVSVYSNSPAARAGLRTGDRILRINGEPISSAQDLVRRIQQMDPQEEAEFTVIQDGRQEELDIVLSSRAETIQRAMARQGGFGDREFGQTRQDATDSRYGYDPGGQRGQAASGRMTSADQRLEQMQRELEQLRQRVQEMERDIQRTAQASQDRYAERSDRERTEGGSRYDGSRYDGSDADRNRGSNFDRSDR